MRETRNFLFFSATTSTIFPCVGVNRLFLPSTPAVKIELFSSRLASHCHHFPSTLFAEAINSHQSGLGG